MKAEGGCWTSLVLLWICGVNLRLTILSIPPVISIIQAELNLTGTQVGLLSGLPVLMFAIAATPGSTLVAWLGVRRALLIGLAITAAGAAMRVAPSNVWQLYLTSIITSSGVALMQPTMAAAVRAWVPQRAAFGTAVYTNGLIFGEIIPVAVMLPFVLPWLGDWRLALGLWCVPVLATAFLLLISQPSSRAAPLTAWKVIWFPDLGSSLNWRIGLILGSVSSAYFCTNGFLPAHLNGSGRPELVSPALTALNLGQLPTSFLLLFIADRIQSKRWPYLLFGLLFIACIIGIMNSASHWTVAWSGLVGATCGAALTLALALPPLFCRHPDEVARVSASAFAISYGFTILVSFVSGLAWDRAGTVNAALMSILVGVLPIVVLAPTLFLPKPAEEK